jgi:hypothetical protein
MLESFLAKSATLRAVEESLKKSHNRSCEK